ncbi:MAG: acyl carrier protein [Terriglobales bacterium]|jgi:acyl carrier protein
MTTQGIKSLESSVKQPTRDRTGDLDDVLRVIYDSISDLNLQLPEDQRIRKSLSTVLFGAGGTLDSLGLANFIVIAEQKLEESYGFRVDLTEDDPFSPTTGHFRTVESLATYVTSLAARRPDSA